MDPEVAFDWDRSNVAHLRRHRVGPLEVEQVLCTGFLDLEYDIEDGEERYKSLGATTSGRILIVVWTKRDGRIRPITAYAAPKRYRTLFLRSGGVQ